MPLYIFGQKGNVLRCENMYLVVLSCPLPLALDTAKLKGLVPSGLRACTLIPMEDEMRIAAVSQAMTRLGMTGDVDGSPEEQRR